MLFTKNDLQLILAALRRAFSRSDIRKRVADKHRIEHEDPKHPRCKKWSWCNNCGQVIPTWRTDVDHISPVVPLDKYTYDMTPHEMLDAIWCDDKNLDFICHTCHDRKSSSESKMRKEYRAKRKADKDGK